jgi:hypothetical protein
VPLLRSDNAIWLFAFGYFACYVPYSALTKAVSGGLMDGRAAVSGFSIVPVATVASLLGMLAFVTGMGWWKYCGRIERFGLSFPGPNRWTFASGLCTAAIALTTTLAYTFSGVSIVFVMLLMRGGVLIIAPVVDVASGRSVRWFSALALVLSLAALLTAFAGRGGFYLTMTATIDIAVYVSSYFVRLRFMSKLAKSTDVDARKRYFVEEQMVAMPALLIVLGVIALIDHGPFMHDIRVGFTSFLSSPAVGEAFLIGIFAQGTGVFGTLVLLDRRENTFCVPVNRASSIMAGVVATYVLALFVGGRSPSAHEMAGAGLIIVAIGFLGVPGVLAARRR